GPLGRNRAAIGVDTVTPNGRFSVTRAAASWQIREMSASFGMRRRSDAAKPVSIGDRARNWQSPARPDTFQIVSSFPRFPARIAVNVVGNGASEFALRCATTKAGFALRTPSLNKT